MSKKKDFNVRWESIRRHHEYRELWRQYEKAKKRVERAIKIRKKLDPQAETTRIHPSVRELEDAFKECFGIHKPVDSETPSSELPDDIFGNYRPAEFLIYNPDVRIEGFEHREGLMKERRELYAEWQECKEKEEQEELEKRLTKIEKEISKIESEIMGEFTKARVTLGQTSRVPVVHLEIDISLARSKEELKKDIDAARDDLIKQLYGGKRLKEDEIKKAFTIWDRRAAEIDSGEPETFSSIGKDFFPDAYSRRDQYDKAYERHCDARDLIRNSLLRDLSPHLKKQSKSK